MSAQDIEKQVAAARAVSYIQDGMQVGLGSGSTSAAAVRLLAERIKTEGLKIVGVPTSSATRALAIELGVPLAKDLSEFQLDLAIDGADEATRNGWLIKGGGGALLQEKIVAAAAKRFLVMIDSSKLVERLGKFALPVEVFQLGYRNIVARLEALGAEVKLRTAKDDSPFVSDEGNYLLDCRFPADLYEDPYTLADQIRNLPGVADHGFFLGMTDTLVIGRGDRAEEIAVSRAS
jgi:ribose 5-phosphate isomerase A